MFYASFAVHSKNLWETFWNLQNLRILWSRKTRFSKSYLDLHEIVSVRENSIFRASFTACQIIVHTGARLSWINVNQDYQKMYFQPLQKKSPITQILRKNSGGFK